jgi:hypothetical protein
MPSYASFDLTHYFLNDIKSPVRVADAAVKVINTVAWQEIKSNHI